jgi:hypothetical protein
MALRFFEASLFLFRLQVDYDGASEQVQVPCTVGLPYNDGIAEDRVSRLSQRRRDE